MKGIWIVITGLDGTGKTTLKRNLIGHLKEKSKKVKDFKLPYDKNLLDLMNNVVGDGQPLQDNYTDQMVFSLDNRIVGMIYVRNWKLSHDYLVSQRGYIDSFVHGKCRGFSYEETDKLQKTHELERAHVMIHLNADPYVAFDRIKNDPDADKFETIEYIIKQSEETKNVYESLINGELNIALSAFKDIQNIYIDTTDITCAETFEIALDKLKQLNILD